MKLKIKKKFPPKADQPLAEKVNKGFTLIEALVFLFIFCIITLTFYQVIAVGSRYIIDAKARLGAVAVANEKMEIIRNLPYENVGTIKGAVTGSLPDSENVAENAGNYKVDTVVQYVDDPLDGTANNGDTASEDYKKVSVKVSWNNEQENVSLESRVVPPGIETAEPGDGILVINIFSDQPGGTGIADSTVHIVNNDTGLDTTLNTDEQGQLVLMGDKIKDSIHKYQITVTKSPDYETIATLPPYPETSFDPVFVHASVMVGTLNETNIVQNKLAQLKVSTTDYLDNAIPNINFHIAGGKTIGNSVPISEDDPTTHPIFNLDEDAQTNSQGEKDFGSVSPGQYTLTLADSALSNYEVIDTDPISPFPLFSENNLNFKYKLAAKNATSLLVRVSKSEDEISVPVAGAQVELKNGSGYDVTQTASSTGTVFFPNSPDTFQPGDYNLIITATGFQENDSSVTVSSNELKISAITLTPSP